MNANFKEKKMIVAHRGDRSRGHENTLEAFRGAIECGADMIEFDIRRTADARLAIHHDAAVGGRAIAEMEYEEVVRRSCALGYRVPLFAEVLELANGRIRMDIELKEAGYEGEVLREIFDHRVAPDLFAITSFFSDAVAAVRGEARTGLLVEQMSWSEAIELYHAIGANFLAPDYTMIGEAGDVPLLPWTVNDAAAIRKLLDVPAVIGVITDGPRDALRIRGAL